jgi:DNA-binding MarR family transcriptional regulator
MLWRVTQAWQAEQRAALRPYGLTHVQFVLLTSLVWLRQDEPVSQRMLADYAQTDIMMTSQVLRALEAKGLLERNPHPIDSRARSLVPTPQGVDLANRTVGVIEEVDRAFFAALEGDQRRFVELLGTLVR